LEGNWKVLELTKWVPATAREGGGLIIDSDQKAKTEILVKLSKNTISRRLIMKLSRRTVLVAAVAVVSAALTITATWAAPPTSKETGLIGAWTGGTDDEYLEWMAIHTGSNPTSGEMLLNWVYVRPGLLSVSHKYPNVTRLTAGHGVWEQIRKRQYRYTWYARGVDDAPNPIVYYTVRVTGLATVTASDNVSINYTYEVFDGFVSPQQMSTLTPFAYQGQASETRLPLVTP
jgi:hypothetical protein